MLQLFFLLHKCVFNAIWENKILRKISEFTVIIDLRGIYQDYKLYMLGNFSCFLLTADFFQNSF